MHGDSRRVLRHFEQRLEGVIHHDFAGDHRDGADGDDAIGAWIQTGRFAVEHDEAYVFDGRLVFPRIVEARPVSIDEARGAHSFLSHSRSAVNWSNCRINRNPLLRTCRSCRLSERGRQLRSRVP